MEAQEEVIGITVNPRSLERLAQSIEERVLEKIKTNPEKYLKNQSKEENDINEDIQLFSTTQAAEKLNVSPAKIRSLCQDGELGYSKPNGKAYRFSNGQLRSYLKTVLNKG